MVNGQKYHILYKTTCTVTGNFYIGVHSTTNLEDGYLGSGKRLSNSIQKHGKENHIREILEFFETREDLLKREREIVNKNLLEDENCLNLKEGGEGGLSLLDDETKFRIRSAGAKATNAKIWKNSSFVTSKSDEMKIRWETNREKMLEISSSSFKGKRHSESTKQLIGIKSSTSQKGEKNSQYGTCWITKDGVNRKIKKEELSNFLLANWIKGRKI